MSSLEMMSALASMPDLMCKVFKAVLAGLAMLLLFGLSGFPGELKTQPNQIESSVFRQMKLTNPQELETFLDKFFAEQMEKEHIPGAVFTLVKDGQIFFSKGYGYADLKKKTPVIPDKTIFRAGSVSKLFTATAVIQLAEQGKLSLSDDVNKYLTRFQLPANYSQPITFANLLTHTSGFDGSTIGTAARSQSDLVPLEEYVSKRLPSRIWPPNVLSAYSSYGLALAGYLVEQISGVPFAQYIDENILQPLGMHRSGFLQPLPPHLEQNLAVGSVYQGGTYWPRPFEYANDTPAVGLSTTATDMAHFMIAHLQQGHYGDAQILQKATAQEMHRQHFTNDPRIAGWAYGFYGRFQNNLRAIEHAGGISGFTSELFLLPEENLGLFIAYNSESLAYNKLIRTFLDHYYPLAAKFTPPKPPRDFLKQANRFGGTYLSLRSSQQTLAKLSSPFYNQVKVTVSQEGWLMLNADQFVEVEPLLFQWTGGNGSYIAFRADASGRITYLFDGINTYKKLAWYETNPVQMGLFRGFGLIFLSGCIIWPIESLVRRWRQKFQRQKYPSLRRTRAMRRARYLAGLISTLYLFCLLIGTALVFFPGESVNLVYGIHPTVVALLCIPPVAVGLTIGLPIFTLLAWKNSYWSLMGRLHYSIITLAALAFIPFLNYWNLLGFQF